MRLSFQWQSPLTLTRNKKLVISKEEIDEIENRPGVYYFARSYGRKSQPFYIGETLGLRSRLKNHLKSVSIVDILRGMQSHGAPEISNGARSFHFAYFDGNKNKENTKKALRIAQKFMIREVLAAGLPLLNAKLTVIQTHDLLFSGNDSGGIFNSKNAVER